MSRNMASVAREQSQAFGVARDFRKSHGESAFIALATTIFNQTDADKSGFIDTSELFDCLGKLGMKLSDEQLLAVLERYDDDGNGQLDGQEWLNVVSDLVDGTFEEKLQGSGGGGGATAAADPNEVAALRKELGSVRAENKALVARVAALELAQQKLEQLTMEAIASAGLGGKASSPAKLKPQPAGFQAALGGSASTQSLMSSASDRPRSGGEVRKSCPTCGHNW